MEEPVQSLKTSKVIRAIVRTPRQSIALEKSAFISPLNSKEISAPYVAERPAAREIKNLVNILAWQVMALK